MCNRPNISKKTSQTGNQKHAYLRFFKKSLKPKLMPPLSLQRGNWGAILKFQIRDAVFYWRFAFYLKFYVISDINIIISATICKSVKKRITSTWK